MIENIIKIFNVKNKNLIVGPGDDCAVIDVGDKKNYFLFTMDELVEDTHFILDFLKPEELASKLVRINVSDIYSMGKAKPLYCLVSGGINFKKINDKWILRFLKELRKELDFFGIINIGGNLTNSEKIFFSMSLTGVVDKKNIVLRKGADERDLLCCVGNLGNSRAFVEVMLSKTRNEMSKTEKKLLSSFVKPVIYSKEAYLISKYATSMIDNSDGLYKTALILSKINNLKVIIDYDNLKNTLSDELVKWCKKNNRDPVEYALFGGEEYNLIFSVKKENLKFLKNVSIIGRFEKGKGVEVLGYYGKIKNFEHF